MLICLSSGASPRYREDILRALAMPVGSILQFRYDQRHLTHVVKNAVDSANAADQPTLIVYIKQPTQDAPAIYVPCRYARIKKVTPHGTTVSLSLSLEEYAYSENLFNFGQWMAAAGGEELPAWSNGEVKGKYWLSAANEPNHCVRNNTLSNWEKIIAQLAAQPDFVEESCFYTITSIRPATKQAPATSSNGVYSLPGGSAYELTLYHYHPSKTPTDLRMEVTLDGDGVEFHTNPVLQIDSRYDQKTVRFKLPSSGFDKVVFLSLLRSTAGSDTLNWQFDLPIEIQGQFWRTFAYGIVSGLLLAATPITTVWANTSISKENALTVTILAFITSLLAGLVAAFGLKKTF